MLRYLHDSNSKLTVVCVTYRLRCWCVFRESMKIWNLFWVRSEASSSWQGGFGIYSGIILPDIPGDCNRRQQPLRNHHIQNLNYFWVRSQAIPAGEEDLESIRGLFCQIFRGTVNVDSNHWETTLWEFGIIFECDPRPLPSSFSWQGGIGIYSGIILLDISGDCNRRQQPVRKCSFTVV